MDLDEESVVNDKLRDYVNEYIFLHRLFNIIQNMKVIKLRLENAEVGLLEKEAEQMELIFKRQA
ncbi:MAG: hypothetical protein U5K00_18515 [Melioribacteraceae bacterium]|nr:hypothetical protein [Melioribacteraceae bacterium]